MLFKKDDVSIDALASHVSTEDLSKTLATLELVQRGGLSNGEDICENIFVLRECIKRQTESTIYMFYSYDGLGEAMGELYGREPDGIAVFQRIGNRLKEIGGFGGSNISDENIGEFAQRNDIKEIFTGNINGEFLGIEENFSDEHADEVYENKVTILKAHQVELLRKLGINVRILNILA